MRVANSTAAAARVFLATTDDPRMRRGLLVAKLTCDLRTGRPVVEPSQRSPLRLSDREHPLGLLPSDAMVVEGSRCEVIVLGHAYAPAGTTVSSQRVSVTVVEHTMAIDVHGDRRWIGAHGSSMTEPEPYQRLPLVWERSFGGAARLWLDRESSLAVGHDLNPGGRGFDARPRAKEIAAMLQCAPGYPVIQDDDRLPNLEDPASPIRARADTPMPVCWATLAPASPVALVEFVELARAGNGIPSATASAAIPRARCHPHALVAAPPPGARVQLRGMSPAGDVRCTLPANKLVFDYAVGPRTGTRDLRIARVVLLPDDGVLEVLYAARFTCDAPIRGEPRSLRLRFAEPTPPSERKDVHE